MDYSQFPASTATWVQDDATHAKAEDFIVGLNGKRVVVTAAPAACTMPPASLMARTAKA